MLAVLPAGVVPFFIAGYWLPNISQRFHRRSSKAEHVKEDKENEAPSKEDQTQGAYWTQVFRSGDRRTYYYRYHGPGLETRELTLLLPPEPILKTVQVADDVAFEEEHSHLQRLDALRMAGQLNSESPWVKAIDKHGVHYRQFYPPEVVTVLPTEGVKDDLGEFSREERSPKPLSAYEQRVLQRELKDRELKDWETGGVAALIASGRQLYEAHYDDHSGGKSADLKACVVMREVEGGAKLKVLYQDGRVETIPKDWARQLSEADVQVKVAISALERKVNDDKTGGVTALIASGRQLYEAHYDDYTPRSAPPASATKMPPSPKNVGDSVEANYHGLGKLYMGTVVTVNPNGTYKVQYHDGECEDEVPEFDVHRLENRGRKSADLKACVVMREAEGGAKLKVLYQDGKVETIPKDWAWQLSEAEVALKREVFDKRGGLTALIASGRQLYEAHYDDHRGKSTDPKACVVMREVEGGAKLKVLYQDGKEEMIPKDWARQLSEAEVEAEAAFPALERGARRSEMSGGGIAALIASGLQLYEAHYLKSGGSKSNDSKMCVVRSMCEVEGVPKLKVLYQDGRVGRIPKDWAWQLSEADVQVEVAISALERKVKDYKTGGLTALIASGRQLYEAHYNEACVVMRKAEGGAKLKVLYQDGRVETIPKDWARQLSEADVQVEVAISALERKVKDYKTGGLTALIASGRQLYEAHYNEACVVMRKAEGGAKLKVLYQDGRVETIPKDWARQLSEADVQVEVAISALERKVKDYKTGGLTALIASGRQLYEAHYDDHSGGKSADLKACVVMREVEGGAKLKVLYQDGRVETIPKDWARQLSEADVQVEVAISALERKVNDDKTGGVAALIASGRQLYEAHYDDHSGGKSADLKACVVMR
eukprot:COSAG02_NODE_5300_length_4459_cov_98.314220_3_plen_886_part_01